jgi:hypothetical protein
MTTILLRRMVGEIRKTEEPPLMLREMAGNYL